MAKVLRELFRPRLDGVVRGKRNLTASTHSSFSLYSVHTKPSVELTASLRQWPVWRLLTAQQIEWGSFMKVAVMSTPFSLGLVGPKASTAEKACTKWAR